jgi:hypothetical protein
LALEFWKKLNGNIPEQYAVSEDGAKAVSLSQKISYYRYFIRTYIHAVHSAYGRMIVYLQLINLFRVLLSENNFSFRYDKGQRFVRHLDGYEYGSMRYDSKEKAAQAPQPRLTFMIYLNEDFEGGNTTFFSAKGKETLSVKPEKGMIFFC